MSYTKQNFTDGEVLTAEHLNKIEDGIVANETALAEKQPKGDYVTKTELNDYQPKGDYVTEEIVDQKISEAQIGISTTTVPVQDANADAVIDGTLTVEDEYVKLTVTRDYEKITPPTTIDSIVLDGKSYREIFETNNIAYCNGFDDGAYPDGFELANGTVEVTGEAYNTPSKSLKVFGSVSCQIKKPASDPPNTPFFLAGKVRVDRYVKGYAGVTLGKPETGAFKTAVTNGFETVSGIFTNDYTLQGVFIGSISSADLDAYIDDPVIIRMSSFTNAPSADELTVAYETYLSIKKGEVSSEPTVEQITGTFNYYLCGEDTKQDSGVAYTDAQCINRMLAYMNYKAKLIGMDNTVYYDTIGLDGNNKTTSLDHCKLLRYASSYNEIARVWGVPNYTVNVMGKQNRKIEVYSTIVPNPYEEHYATDLDNYYDILGGKTGSAHSKYNLGVIVDGGEEVNHQLFAVTILGCQATTPNNGASNNRHAVAKIAMDEAIKKFKNPTYTVDTSKIKADACSIIAMPSANGAMYNAGSTCVDLIGLNNTAKIVPASMTKVMTFICAVEQCVHMNEHLTYNKGDEDTTGSGHNFYAGDVVTFRDALYAMILESSNDTARMLGRISGERLLKSEVL